MSDKKHTNGKPVIYLDWSEVENSVDPERFTRYEFLFPEQELTEEQAALVAEAQWPEGFDPAELQNGKGKSQEAEVNEAQPTPDEVSHQNNVQEAIIKRSTLVFEIILQLNGWIGDQFVDVMKRIDMNRNKPALAAFAEEEGETIFSKLYNELGVIEDQESEQLIKMPFGEPEPAQIIAMAVAARIRVEEAIQYLLSRLAIHQQVSYEQATRNVVAMFLGDDLDD